MAKRLGWGWWVWLWLLAWAALGQGGAQGVGTTTVADTVYRADGSAAGGSLLVSWPGFTTATGQSVPAGSLPVTVGAGGQLSVALVPNAGSVPMGSYYTVVYHLDDGTATREYWVVPVSAQPVKLSAIRSTVVPSSVALQTVSKQYVDQAIASAVVGHPVGAGTGPIPALSLPVFQGSGPDHMQGAVPDPGATAGSTRYLREDGLWSAVAQPAAATGLAAAAAQLQALPQRNHLLGEYLLMEGAGTVAHDTSGRATMPRLWAARCGKDRWTWTSG